MCYLNEKYGKPSFTGYKVVLRRDDGRMFSPCTGVEYVAGQPVQAHSGMAKLCSAGFKENLCCSFGNGEKHYPTLFHDSMTGRTAAFRDAHAARELMSALWNFSVFDNGEKSSRYTVALAEITLSGELVSGMYDSAPVVAGKFIEEIAIVP